MFGGQENATHHVVALPDHPHFLRCLDEVEWLEWKQQLARNTARIAARLCRKRHLTDALQRFLIRIRHQFRRPWLEHRILAIADTQCRLRPGPSGIGIAKEW